jgi:RHS repeat-associated protein
VGHPLLLRTAWALVALLALGLPSRANAQTAETPNFTIEYHHDDLSGNLRLTTDEYGTVVREAIHLPFGERDTGECGTREDGARPLGHQGKPRDPKTCLDDFGARDYHAAIGRFQTVDPVLPVNRALRDPQPWNRYAYARNNPLIYSDPDGRFIVPLVVAAVSASYAYFEAASTAYDVYDAAKTLTDPTASTGAKAMAVGAVLLGTITVGSGSVWVKGGKEVAEHASDGVKAARATAATRAAEIQGALGARTQRAVTTAVTETREGVRVVTSSEGRLRPAQRAVLQPGEVAGVGQRGVHAEVNGVNAARDMGLTPTGVAPSRPACPGCTQAMGDLGVPIIRP